MDSNLDQAKQAYMIYGYLFSKLPSGDTIK